ncbi:MAG: leucine-rich repeat protein [Paludibacteraceae bacterium]|nr:leucine-rich repeat protein [Paludibacteraceae bacterium]
MALIKCPKCGKEFSDRAQVCPQCGTSKEEVQRLIKEQAEREAAERERIRKEREAKEAEEARIRAKKRTTLWIVAVVIAVFVLVSGYTVHINSMPISAKNSAELLSALHNPLRFSKESVIVKIPDNVTSIEDNAFVDCIELTSVEIPNSVTSIGVSAFRGCKGLTSVTIPNSVTSIGFIAFQKCTSLTSVVIPNSVTSIDSWAFQYCKIRTLTIPYRFRGKLELTDYTEVIYY